MAAMDSAVAMEADNTAIAEPNGVVAEAEPAAVPPPPNPLLDKYNEQWAAVQHRLDDFNGWTALLSTAEKLDVMTHIQAAYDAFLAQFPLCYGYWKKYAAAAKRHGDDDAAAAVLERGVAAVPYSLDLWVHYALFQQGREGSSAEDVRSLYERAVAYVGTDFNAHMLWDKWLAYETANGTPQHVAALYSRILACPIKELERYYTNLKEFAGVRTVGELLLADQITALRAQLPPPPPKPEPMPALEPEAAAAAEPSAGGMQVLAEAAPGEDAETSDEAAAAAAAAAAPAAPAGEAAPAGDGTAAAAPGDQGDGAAAHAPAPPAASADTAAADAAAADAAAADGDASIEDDTEEARLKDAWLQRCEAAYTAAAAELAWRRLFEEAVKRPYFHVKPLDAAQLANWGAYLEAAEGKLRAQEGDVGALVVLYERCLVPCASYPEFWQRYVRFLEGAPGLGTSAAAAALQRATGSFCRRRPELQLFGARFLERTGDVEGARTAYQLVLAELSPGLLEAIVSYANFERRNGSREAACSAFDTALTKEAEALTATANGDASAQQQSDASAASTYTFLCLQYAYFLRVGCQDLEAGRKVLERGLAAAPSSRALWEGAIWFEESGAVEARVERALGLYERALAAVPAGGASSNGSADAAENAPKFALSEKDREELSVRSVEFADSAGSLEQLAAVEARHAQRFPHLLRGGAVGASSSADARKRAHADASAGAPASKQAKVVDGAAAAAGAAGAVGAGYYPPPPPADPVAAAAAAAAYGADPYAGYYAQQHYGGYHHHHPYPPYGY